MTNLNKFALGANSILLIVAKMGVRFVRSEMNIAGKIKIFQKKCLQSPKIDYLCNVFVGGKDNEILK